MQIPWISGSLLDAIQHSETTVQVQGKLVDLKTGTTLWQGVAQASSVEGEQQQGGLGALLVSAIIKQVLASTFDNSHKYSGIATERLLATGEKSSGLLFGPRSPSAYSIDGGHSFHVDRGHSSMRWRTPSLVS